MVTGPDGVHGVHVLSHVELDQRSEQERVQTQHPSIMEQTVQDLIAILVLVHFPIVQVGNLSNI